MTLFTYRKAGVDIEKGEVFVKKISEIVKKVKDPRIVSGIGGFSGIYSPPEGKGFLALTCDGVGTKLLLASLLGDYYTVGIDAVAMNVNDLLSGGARPLLFLDYLATSKLEIKNALRLVEGMVEGCSQAGCTLLGGETAEMPGMYKKGDYEVAGFALGWVREGELMRKEDIHQGDLLVGIASSGLHSNGYSLVRKILFKGKKKKEEKVKFLNTFSPRLQKKWGEELLTPTRIYSRSIVSLWDKGIKVKGIAHITGGGIPGNLSRILPSGLGARIKRNWEVPEIFSILQEIGKIKEEEMFRVFNMGLGLILVIPPEMEKDVREHLEIKGERTYHIGKIIKGESIRIE